MSTSNDLLSSTSGSFNSINRSQFSNGGSALNPSSYFSTQYLSDCFGNLSARTIKFFQDNDAHTATAAFIATNCLLIYLLRKVVQVSTDVFSSRFSAFQNNEGVPRRIFNGMSSLGAGAATYYFNTFFSQVVNYNMNRTVNVICSCVTVIFVFKKVNDGLSSSPSTVSPLSVKKTRKEKSKSSEVKKNDEKEEKSSLSRLSPQQISSSSSTSQLKGNHSGNGESEGSHPNDREEKSLPIEIMISTPPASLTGRGSISGPEELVTSDRKLHSTPQREKSTTSVKSPGSGVVTPIIKYHEQLHAIEQNQINADGSTPDRSPNRRSSIVTEKPVKLS